MGEPDEPSYAGVVMVKDHGVEVTQADPYVRVSLALLMDCDRRSIRLSGNYLLLGTLDHNPVSYEIVGWDGNGALLCDRIDPPILEHGTNSEGGKSGG